MSDTNNNDTRSWLKIPSRNTAQPPAGEQGSASTDGAQGPDQATHQQAGESGHAQAARTARTQINRIYDNNPPHQELSEQQTGQAQNQGTGMVTGLYDRERGPGAANFDWRAYHLAWQDYYQKYYHRHYLQRLHAERQRQQQRRAEAAAATSGPAAPAPASQPETAAAGRQDEQHGAHSSDDFRGQLLGTISQRAKKARRSSHFWPIASAVIVAVLFLLLNYNKLLIAQAHAYISPSTRVSDSVIVDPNANIPVSDKPKLLIPKLNVEAPLIFGLDSLDNASTQEALKHGVVHYPIPGASAVPGQKGNAVFLGHSSHTVWNNGDYKFVFVLLPRMEQGDLFYIHYQGKRYVYQVTRKQVIQPDQIEALVIGNDKPMATLVTCVPIGTNNKRLLVFGKQIRPDPSKAEPVTHTGNDTPDNITIPGNSPTLLEQIF